MTSREEEEASERKPVTQSATDTWGTCEPGAHETMTEPTSEPTLHNYLTALNLPSEDSNSSEVL